MLDEIGIAEAEARRLMAIARRFSNRPSLDDLPRSVSALYELSRMAPDGIEQCGRPVKGIGGFVLIGRELIARNSSGVVHGDRWIIRWQLEHSNARSVSFVSTVPLMCSGRV